MREAGPSAVRWSQVTFKTDRTSRKPHRKAADATAVPVGDQAGKCRTCSFSWERSLGFRTSADLNLDIQDISRQQYRMPRRVRLPQKATPNQFGYNTSSPRYITLLGLIAMGLR